MRDSVRIAVGKKETIDQPYGSNSNSNQRALEAESQTGYQCNSQCECCECEEGGGKSRVESVF